MGKHELYRKLAMDALVNVYYEAVLHYKPYTGTRRFLIYVRERVDFTTPGHTTIETGWELLRTTDTFRYLNQLQEYYVYLEPERDADDFYLKHIRERSILVNKGLLMVPRAWIRLHIIQDLWSVVKREWRKQYFPELK